MSSGDAASGQRWLDNRSGTSVARCIDALYDDAVERTLRARSGDVGNLEENRVHLV